MTKVDNYLEKYLDGSISERELQQFRDLLDAEPRLHSELSKTLELRSIIHDDLLALTPPEDLSEFVRENLAGQFAALATEEEEERPRPFFTGRLAGSSLVAMVALVLIALAPTWIAPSGNDSLAGFIDAGTLSPSLADVGSQQVGSAVRQTPTAPALTVSESSSIVDIQEKRGGTSSSLQVGSANSVTTDPSTQGNQIALSTDLPSVLKQEETRSIYLSDGESVEPTVASNDLLPEQKNSADRMVAEEGLASNSLSLSSIHLDLMGQDPDQAFKEIRTNSSLFQKTDIVDHAAESLAQLDHGDLEASRSRADRSLPSLDGSESNRRRIMFGGTLASGLTTRESTFSVQGSAYMAMAVGEGSRIGLEGGSAMFSYRKVVTVQTPTSQPEAFGRRTVDRGEPQGSNGNLSGETSRIGGIGGPTGEETNSGRATDIANEAGSVNRGDGGSRDWKSTQLLGGGNSIVQPAGNNSGFHYDYQSYEAETSMIYGLVFYDHTVTSLNKKLNINGRIGVGGADGGIVLNARAYAAISTHENVAWTLGVGGSMLHDFANDVDFNANYGVNAGVELGF